MVQDKFKTPPTKPTMKVQKWLSLREAYPKGHTISRLKGGSRIPVNGDKVIKGLRTPHLVTQVAYSAKRVKHRISAIMRGDKE